MANGSRTARTIGILMLIVSAGILTLLAYQRANRDPAAVETRDVPRERRSILMVTVDTTRADRLQPYGADNIATPTMLRMAQEGIVFEKAYSVAPITLVAHTSIMTGLYPFEHGVRNNGIQYVPADVETMAEQLKAEGYRTGAFVSAAVLEKRYGLDQGFEVYDDDLSSGRDRRPRMVADRPAEAVVASAVEWMESLDEDEDYFAWIHLYDPHASYSPPAPYRDRYRERLYDGEIAYMDAQIGKLFEHPRVADKEPIITVIGDHGESLGEHGERTHAMLAYDSTLHIPFLLKIPGGPQGLRVERSVSQVDVPSTLLELVGLKAVETNHGESLVSLIGGAASKPRPLYSETYLPFYTYGWAKLKVLRLGNWKFIDAPEPELFDLRRDPKELSNVHDSQAGPAHDMTRDLNELLGTVDDAEQEAALSLDTESEEKLRSLGYLAAGSGRDREGPRPDPKNVVDLHVSLEQARAFLQDRLFDRAETALRAVLQRDPENLAALIDLVQALEGQERVEDAVKTAERALEIDPDYTRMYTVLARLEARRDNMDQALELADLAVAADPKNPEYLMSKVRLTLRAGKAAEARELMKEGLESFSEVPRFNVEYAALVEIQEGKTAEAEERLRSALKLDPFSATAWSQLGRLMEGDGRIEEATEAYRTGLERDSDSPDLHGRLGQLLARTAGGVEAIQHLREAIRLAPGFQPSYYVSLGAALAEMGQMEEAKVQYDKVLTEDPTNPGAINNKAIALYRTGKLAEAESLLKGLLEEMPNNKDGHTNVAAIAVDTRQWKKAEVHSRRALELDESLVEAWNNLAIAVEEQGRAEEAKTAYRRGLSLNAGYWPASLNLGVLLSKEGEHEAAAEALGTVLARVPQQSLAHLELGKLYEGPLQDVAKARAHFNAFLRYAPNDPRGADVRERLGKLNLSQ